ncbi:MAG: GNAT family N-acetyltransferase [Halioglobus sp.]|nr:GNAT family N-acetyltransferase [Halioglobus sp.]
MNIVEITADETLPLRCEVLRPGLTAAECAFEGDKDRSARHFGIIEGAAIVGIVSLYQRRNSCVSAGLSYQLRGMAITKSRRGRGLGRLLLVAAEHYMAQHGATCAWANARSAALDFYCKAGYRVRSDEFLIEGVGPHYLVSKSIA